MAADSTPIIEVTDLTRDFSGRKVLNGISFSVMKGETMIVMGGSGCGKSTLLRHLIGAMKPSGGSIKLFGEEITTMNEAALANVRRRFGVLFQSGALLQSMTVGENVALPIVERGKLAPAIVDLMVKMKLEMVGLTGFIGENTCPKANTMNQSFSFPAATKCAKRSRVLRIPPWSEVRGIPGTMAARREPSIRYATGTGGPAAVINFAAPGDWPSSSRMNSSMVTTVPSRLNTCAPSSGERRHSTNARQHLQRTGGPYGQ